MFFPYEDFEGEWCERSHDDCDGVVCEGQGQCVDGNGIHYCECPLGTAGIQCEKGSNNLILSSYSIMVWHIVCVSCLVF